jgi:hypothetical protein
MEINVAIPRAVQEAADRAEALHKQVYEIQPDGEPQPTPTETQDPAPTGDPVPDVQGLTPPSDDTAAAPPTGELPDQQKKDDPWEQRYKVIEGKYRAEVPRLNADNRELRQQLEALQNEVEQLKSRGTQEPSSLISAEDREKYGDDLLDVIKRAAQEQVSAKDGEIADLKRQLESVTTTTAKSAEVSFFDQLGNLVPDWVAINGEDQFLKWLDEHDEFTGRTRQDLLSDAEKARDANRVAKFFTSWKATQESQTTNTQRNLEAQVTPDSNRVSKPPVGKRFFTRADIGAFYAAARRGEISAKDMVAMEAEIHAATLEGRIR